MELHLPASIVAPPNWGLRCAIALGLAIAFGMVAHTWKASAIMAQQEGQEAHKQENRFAQQQATTTSSSVVGFFLLGGLGIALAAASSWQGLRWFHPVALLFFLYVAWCVASFTWSDSQFLTIRKLAILALIIAGAYGTAMKGTLQDLLWAAVIYLVGTLLIGVLAELSVGAFRPWRSEYRFAGTTDPNGLGLEAAALALLSWFLEFQRRDRAALRYLLIAMGVVALSFTKSRTSLAALVAASFVAILLRAQGQQRLLLGSGVLALGCVIGLASNFISVGALKESAEVASMGRNEHVSSLTGRLPLWQAVVKSAEAAPYAGHGYGGFWTPPRIYKYSEMFRWQIPHAHNAYLDLVLATGLIGLALYLIWAIALAIAAFMRYERFSNPGDLAVACFVVFTLVHGLAESKIPSAGMTTYLLYALGASIALKPPEGAEARSVDSEKSPLLANVIWKPSRRALA